MFTRCPYLHGRPDTHTDLHFFPSFLVYPGCLYADNGAIIFIDDGITEHGGLVHVYHLAVHLIFCADKWKRGDHSKPSYTLSMSKLDEDASDIEKLRISCNKIFNKKNLLSMTRLLFHRRMRCSILIVG